MKTKKDKSYSFEHTKQRALERYGVELTPAIYEEWNALCKFSTRIQIDKSNRQTVHVIEWCGRLLTVVQSYSSSSNEPSYIKTVLPSGTKLMFGKDLPNSLKCGKVSNWYKSNGSTTQQKTLR